MYFTKSSIVAFSLLASSSLVAGHGAIIGATGDAGGKGSAIGVDPSTPRDGTGRNPFQQDSTRFKGDAAATCGETLGGGANDIQAGTAQVMQLNGGTLPQVSAGGQIMMTVHQVNSDGAGPYTCMIDATGTGTNWQAITVTQNLPGNARGRNQDTQKQDLPLTASIPAGMNCTGTVAGQSNVCMVRCQNPARAGPFGGCVPVQMAGAAPAAAASAAPVASGVAPAGEFPDLFTYRHNLTPLAAASAAPLQTSTAGTQPAANVPAANAPTANVPTANTPTANTPNANVPNANVPTANVPSANTPSANAPSANVPTANVPSANVPSANVPSANVPSANVPSANVPTANTPATGRSSNVGTTTGTTPATTPATAPVTGAAARKRAAAKNQPALTNDDQEEEVDLLNDDESDF